MAALIDFLANNRCSYSAAAPGEQKTNDSKKLGKVKKPDENLVSGVSPGGLGRTWSRSGLTSER